MPLIAWIAIPRRPMKMTPRYILSQSRSTSSGSSPISSSRRLFAIACEPGALTSAATASGAESTSPMPVIPSSVWTRMTRSSWLPSAIPSFTAGCRRTTASTSVIFKQGSLERCRAGPHQARLSIITRLSTISASGPVWQSAAMPEDHFGERVAAAVRRVGRRHVRRLRSSSPSSTSSPTSPATAPRSSSGSAPAASRCRSRSAASACTASTCPRRWSRGCAPSPAAEQIDVDDRRLRHDDGRRHVLGRLPRLQHDHEPDDAGRAGRVLPERRRAPRARRLLRRSRWASRISGGSRPARPSGRSTSAPTQARLRRVRRRVAGPDLASLPGRRRRRSRCCSVPFRYVWPAELDLMARLAGMTLRERWSGWSASRSPARAPSTSPSGRRRPHASRAGTTCVARRSSSVSRRRITSAASPCDEHGGRARQQVELVREHLRVAADVQHGEQVALVERGQRRRSPRRSSTHVGPTTLTSVSPASRPFVAWTIS